MLNEQGNASHEATRYSTGATVPKLQIPQAAFGMIAGRDNSSARLFTQAGLPQWYVHEAGALFYAACCSSHSRIGASKKKGEWVGLATVRGGRRNGNKKGVPVWRREGNAEHAEKKVREWCLAAVFLGGGAPCHFSLGSSGSTSSSSRSLSASTPPALWPH